MTGRKASWRSEMTSAAPSRATVFGCDAGSLAMAVRSGRGWNRHVLTAADRSSATVASVAVLDAEPHSLGEQLKNQLIQPERHGHVILGLRERRGRLSR